MNRATRLTLSSLVAATALGLMLWQLQRPPPLAPAKRPLVLYCAAGLQLPVDAVVAEYQAAFDRLIQVQYGGSGTLLNNLRLTGTGDLYLAADATYLDIARSNGLVAEVLPLAVMTPVLAVARGNPLGILAVNELGRADVRFALANPDAAAIGKVTRDLLESAGLWTDLASQARVFKPTVNDVANDLKLGAVDAGILWDAVVEQYPELEIVRDPILATGATPVGVGVLRASRQPTAALHFARYLTARDRGLKIFAEQGYRVLEGDVWADRPRVVLFSGGVNRLAIEDTLTAFETREGVELNRVYNGCGILVAQMRAGERPDAYFACDLSFMTNVQEWFDAAVALSETDMVILVQRGNPRSVRDLSDLTQPGLRVGVANPEQSALGALTARLLEAANLHEAVKRNVRVQTPTADLLVNQMRTGALDAAIVYEANTRQVQDTLAIVRLTQPQAKAIQPYAVGQQSSHRHLMQRLLEALRSDPSRRQFEVTGFRWLASASVPETER